jgi:hypothetical protein
MNVSPLYSMVWIKAPAPAETDGDPSTRLTGRVQFGPVELWVEFLAVEDQDDQQRGCGQTCDEMINDAYQAFALDGRLQTVALNGRQYLVFMYPVKG